MADLGHAAVITVDWDAEEVMWSIFTESAATPDPLLAAQRFRSSIGKDFPTSEHHIIGDERAKDIQVARLLGGLAR